MAADSNSERLGGKRIAITGAGSGLGRELALSFARAGWRVAVTDIQTGRARRVAGEVNDAGGEAMAQTLDTRESDDFDALARRVSDEWGGLDVFVNNAGVSSAGLVTDTSEADWDWMLDINLMGTVRGSRAMLPMLRESRGHLVNTASFAAIANAPGMAAYNVAKAGVLSLSESLRAEEHAHGVGVTVACPAFFATNLLDSFRGTNDRQKAMVRKLMDRAKITAADVAAEIHDAVLENRFLVIPGRTARWQYRMKRLSPDTFFDAVLKATQSFTRS
ncbi:SDR family oxidoreductase [Salinisphaera aquimarina]|uniref:SDR family oxidoreductase n=1 Tax=Salinisphaera aquimarina TaxID=2094031 RepID=A0ABV7EQF2_9GAMM